MGTALAGLYGRKGMRTCGLVVAVIATMTLGALSCDHAPTTPRLDQLALDVVSGDRQTAVVGTQLAPLIVKVTSGGNPVAQQVLNFHVVSGGGSIYGGAELTDNDGIAQELWTLGTNASVAETVEVRAVESSTGAEQVFGVFTATAIADRPESLLVAAGDSQSVVAGAAVATPPTVKMTDRYGNPIVGASVSFAVASGGGTATGQSQSTNTLGLAAVGSWKLGPTAGANTLTASTPSLTLGGSPVTVTAFGTAGSAAQLLLSSGNNQSGSVGAVLPQNPTVRVTDANGNGVAGAAVTFTVTKGGGQIDGVGSVTALTGSAGTAAVDWTLGALAGSNSLQATAVGLTGSPVTFAATGTAGAPTQIAANAGDNQSAVVGTTVPTPPSVIVRDQFNNPVNGVLVTFALATGGGGLTGVSEATNAAGIATVGSWKLGNAAGPNTLTATSTGLTGSPVTFTATGSAGVVVRVLVSPPGATIAGSSGTQSLMATPQDAFGNPVNAAIAWASLNPNVATVNGSTGVVTAISSGQVPISAATGGVTGFALVTVAIPGATPVNLWTPMLTPTGTGGTGIWGSSGSDVFSVCCGVILHYNGSSWTQMANPSGVNPRAVWGTSGTNVYAVGSQQIVHYDGTSWRQVLSLSDDLFSVWGSSPSDVFAVGYNGTISHYDGSSWSLMTTVPGGLTGGASVWGTSSSNVYVAGQGQILHYDGASWHAVVTAPTVGFGRLWGTSASDIYNAAAGGTWHFDGTTWSLMPNSPGGLGIWGSSSSDLYTVYQSSGISRFDGVNWSSTFGTPGGNDLYGIWGTSGSDVYAAGGAPMLRGVRGATVAVTPANPVIVGIGMTQQLTATARDAQSNVINGLSNTSYAWTSRSNSVATVDAAGLVTATGIGTTVVVAVAPGGAADSTTVTVTVSQAWTQLSPTPDPTYGTPSPRVWNTMVYNTASKRMIVFGGGGSGGYGILNDVWVLTNADGTGGAPAWTKLNPSGAAPGAREAHVAVYDQANNIMIIHGGYNTPGNCGGVVSDVWVLSNADGTGGTPTWTQLSPSGAAPGRRFHGAAYDAVNNRLIITGGQSSGCGSPGNDTWVLTNANGLGGTPVWTQLAPTTPSSFPSGVSGGNTEYDAATNTLILFQTNSSGSASTWLLSSANGLGGLPAWNELVVSTPPSLVNWIGGGIYDQSTRAFVFFGGGSSVSNETWRLTNANGVGANQWTQLSPTGTLPDGRLWSFAAYTPATDRMTVYGGSKNGWDGTNEVWVLTSVLH